MSFFKDIFKKLFSLKSIFFILTFSLVPVFFAYAAFDPVGYLGGVVNGGFNWVGSQGGEMAKGIIAAVVVAFSQFAIWILSLSLWFLNWTSSGDFINGDVVGMSNPIISVGWTAMRNIANILLIFGLVAIAISIMLGYEETKAKKMLITFVWIALLINFTPVICNAFVDIAQIIMKSFLSGGVSDTLVYQISENIKSPQKTELIAPTMVLFIFSLFASFIYALYGILFLIRYIQIWMLVIISPVAFATHAFPEKVSSKWLSKILPPQCFWDRWWDDFLKYTFIGVPAAFSIYLSNVLMAAVQKNPQVLTSTPSGGVVEAGFSTLFSYIIPFAVLLQGFFMTMETGSQIGGNTLKGVYSSAVNKTKGMIKRNTLDRAGNTIKAGISGAKESWAVQRSEMREQKRAGTADTGTAAWFKRRGASVKATVGGGVGGAWSATGISDADKAIVDRKVIEKAESDASARVKVLSKSQQDNILAKTDSSAETKYEQNAIVQDRITKGKATESDLNFAFASPNGAKKTKNAAITELAKRGELKDNHLQNIFDNPQTYESNVKSAAIQSLIDSGNFDESKVLHVLGNANDFDSKTRNSMVQSLIKEKAIKQSYIKTFTANPDILDAKTKGSLMSFMPELVPVFDAANRNGRTDDEMIADAVRKMSPKVQNEINPESLAGNGAVLAGLNNKEQVKRILNQLPEDAAKKIHNDDKNLIIAQQVLSTRTPISGITIEEAQRIITYDKKAKKPILDRIKTLNKIVRNPRSTPEQISMATEELQNQTKKLNERTRNIKGMF